MSLRSRKFIGTILCICFLLTYCLIAMAVGGEYVTGAADWLQILFFLVAGTAWLPGAMLIIRWMSGAGQ